MKRLLAAAAAGMLVLAGCSEGETEDPATSSPSASEVTSDTPTEEEGPPIALDSVCDLLLEQSAMPHDDEVEYLDAGSGAGEYMVRCKIEPAVWGEAAALGEIGLADVEFCNVYPGGPGTYRLFESDKDAEYHWVNEGAEY